MNKKCLSEPENISETKEQTAHLLFGLESVRDLLAKAIRERDRFLEAQDVVVKTDHALNFVLTASNLEDWVFHLYIKGNHDEWSDYQKSGRFDKWVRDKSLGMRFLADINNATKHRVLRNRGSAANAAKVGCIVYHIEHLPNYESFMEKISKFSEIISVKEIYDGNDITGYEVRAKTHIFSTSQGFHLFIDIANEVIRFWEEFIEERDL